MKKYLTTTEALADDNAWKEVHFEVSVRTIKYGPRANKWKLPTVELIDGIHAPQGMKLEMKRLDTNRTKKVGHIQLSLGQDRVYDTKEMAIEIDTDLDLSKFNVFVVWERGEPWKDTKDVLVPVEKVIFRVEDALLRKTKWLMDNVQVGDFVKCKGTRSGDWNKVENINEKRTIVYGPKYSEPKEGCMRYASSDNGIEKIIKVVRDGKQIFPPK